MRELDGKIVFSLLLELGFENEFVARCMYSFL